MDTRRLDFKGAAKGSEISWSHDPTTVQDPMHRQAPLQQTPCVRQSGPSLSSVNRRKNIHEPTECDRIRLRHVETVVAALVVRG